MNEMKDLKELSVEILDLLKQEGADDAMVTLSSGSMTEFNVDGGDLSLLRTLFNDSVAMMAIKDKKKGVISVNSFEADDVKNAVKNCIEAANSGIEDEALAISELTENEDFLTGITKFDREKLLYRIKEYMDDVARDYPKIIIEQLIVSYGMSERCVANTNGVCYTQQSGYYSLYSMFSAHEGENGTSFNGISFDFYDLDTPLIEINRQREDYERAEKELYAKAIDGKFVGKVLASPDMFAEFVGTALDNFISDSVIIDSTSPWREKLNTKVASEKLSVRCIPVDERMIGSSLIHSDGYKNENFDFIRNGVLKSFDLSLYASNRTGLDRVKATSSCIEIDGGNTPLDELIKGIDKGIFICRFSGGAPASNGDISGVAKNSFMIENGEITHALTETMISGNLEEMINNIVELSKETFCDGSSVLPYALIDGVTISGK